MRLLNRIVQITVAGFVGHAGGRRNFASRDNFSAFHAHAGLALLMPVVTTAGIIYRFSHQ